MNRPCHQHHQVVKHWGCYDRKPSVILVWGWIHDPHFFPKTHIRLSSGHFQKWTHTKSQHSSVNNQYHCLINSTKTTLSLKVSFVAYSRRRRSIFLFIIFLIILLFVFFLIFFLILFFIFFLFLLVFVFFYVFLFVFLFAEGNILGCFYLN